MDVYLLIFFFQNEFKKIYKIKNVRRKLTQHEYVVLNS